MQSPISELGEDRSQEAKDRRERRRRRRKKRTQSLPRDALRDNDDSESERGTVRGRKKGRESKRREQKSRSEERVRRVSESDEEELEREVVEKRKEEKMEERDLEREESDQEVFLPVPSPEQKLPSPKQNWEVESNQWEVAAEYIERRREEAQDGSWEDGRDENGETELKEEAAERPLPAAAAMDTASRRKPFSFLTAVSVEQLEDAESDSGDSQSDASMSAASISGLSLATARTRGRKTGLLPGPWLKPSRERVAEVIEEPFVFYHCRVQRNFWTMIQSFFTDFP